MIYLLDTDTLIFLIRGLKNRSNEERRRQAKNLIDRCRLSSSDGHSVGLSAITVSELEFGAQKSDRYEQEISAVRKTLTPFDVYPYDAEDCPRHYGRIRHELERAGMSIGSMDLLIAAHALSLDATLVSSNLSHFSRVRQLKATSWLGQP